MQLFTAVKTSQDKSQAIRILNPENTLTCNLCYDKKKNLPCLGWSLSSHTAESDIQKEVQAWAWMNENSLLLNVDSDPLVVFGELHNLGITVHTCNPSTQVIKCETIMHCKGSR